MVTRRLKLSAFAAIASFAMINACAFGRHASASSWLRRWIFQAGICAAISASATSRSVAYSMKTTAGFDSVRNVDKGFDAAPFFGLGVGYTVNNWLRVDVTGEYRGAANFHGLDVGNIGGGALRRRSLYRQQVRVDLPVQRLCRSRHLVEFHAICRRRRRLQPQHDHQFRRHLGLREQCVVRGSGGSDAYAGTPANGISHGRCTPVSPTRFSAMSRSSSPIGTSTWAMRRAATSPHSTAPTHQQSDGIPSSDVAGRQAWRAFQLRRLRLCRRRHRRCAAEVRGEWIGGRQWWKRTGLRS